MPRRSGTISRRSFRSRFEPLEARCCPSAAPFGIPHPPSATTTPPPTASVTTNGHTISVKDSNVGDTITVTDDGAGDINVTITNSTGPVTSGTGTGITNVRISATGGGDTIDYTYGAATPVLGAAIKSPNATSAANHEDIDINATKGSNDVSLDFSAGVTSANVDLDVDVSGGSNKVVETVGALTSAHFDSNISGDAGCTSTSTGGGDTIGVTQTGAITTSKAALDVYGSGGGENLSADVAGDIAADSAVAENVGGGGAKGGDTIEASYTGALNGKLFVSTTGEGGNETISQNITVNTGSTGKLFSFIYAGKAPKNATTPANNITLTLQDNTGTPSTLASANAVVVDQTGDTLTQNVSANQTANVHVITQSGWGWGWLGGFFGGLFGG